MGKLLGPTDGVILLGSFEGEMVGYSDPEPMGCNITEGMKEGETVSKLVGTTDGLILLDL